MKNGTYRVSFLVELNDCATKEEAEQDVATLMSDAIDEDTFPEVEFELVEELDVEYNTEEGELEPLDFG